MQIKIRNYTNTDITIITTIQKDAVLEGLGSFALTPMNEQEMLSKFQDLLESGYPCFVAELNNEVIGFAHASSHRSRPGYRWTVEDSVYVRRDKQGKGVGRMLLTRLIKDCTDLGFRQMVAVIGDSNNQGSIKLHEKCGFEMMGKLKSVGYKKEQWLDVVHMQKPLGLSDENQPIESKYPGTLFKN